MSARNFKRGDKVRVRYDLVSGFDYGGWYLNSEMYSHLGEKFEIISVDVNHYTLSGSKWGWTDEMLEYAITEAEIDRSIHDDGSNIESLQEVPMEHLLNLYKS